MPANRAAKPHESSTVVVYAALVGNILVALSKAVAAVWTGSAGMVSETIHSTVDTCNEILLLHGLKSAERRPDREHPLGYGRELYFWSFIVALLVFAVGCGASIYEGWLHIRTPEPIRNPTVNYVVLALSALFEGASWTVSFRQFREAKGELGFYEAFRRSKDPPSFMVLFEDSAALLGIAVAALGNLAVQLTGEPRLDGVASIVIGLILGGTAILLARESKSLLIGEAANPGLATSVLSIAASQDGVRAANGLITVQLAPDQVVAALSLEFEDDLRAPQIEEIVTQVEQEVTRAHPQIVMLFVKPQTPETFQTHRKRRFGVRLRGR
jgi:cation diffusion facilitator family transporter